MRYLFSRNIKQTGFGYTWRMRPYTKTGRIPRIIILPITGANIVIGFILKIIMFFLLVFGLKSAHQYYFDGIWYGS